MPSNKNNSKSNKTKMRQRKGGDQTNRHAERVLNQRESGEQCLGRRLKVGLKLKATGSD